MEMMRDDTFDEVTCVVTDAIRLYIDHRHRRTGFEKRELALEAGKALVMCGCSFIGNALGFHDPAEGLRPGRELLARFEAMVRARGIGGSEEEQGDAGRKLR